MIDLHKDQANLVNISLIVFLLLSFGVAVVPAGDMQDNNQPLPGMPELTDQERRGLAVYIAEGCVACHTQQVRNIEMDRTWGSRPSLPSDYHYSKQRMNVWQQSPSLLGSERTGPDLTNVGKRQSGTQWHLLHLYDPRMVVKGSIMPRYGWLFREVDPAMVKENDVMVPVPADRLQHPDRKLIATQKANDLVAYLLSLKQAPLPDGSGPLVFLPTPGANGDIAALTPPDGSPDGGSIYSQVCAACHQADAKGLPGAFPPLTGSQIVNMEDATEMINIVLGGYDAQDDFGIMPAQAGNLSDEEVTAVVNYVRQNFGNDAPPTTIEAVGSARMNVAPETALK